MSAPNDEPLTGGTAQGLGDSLNNNTDSIAQHDDARKAWATLQAEAALAGCELHRMDDGAIVLSRWGHCRELPSIADVRALLARIGGVR